MITQSSSAHKDNMEVEVEVEERKKLRVSVHSMAVQCIRGKETTRNQSTSN